MSSSIDQNDRFLRVPGHELELHWRSTRHARRLLTLGVAGVFIALVARRPEFAGVAAPALLLLAAGRVQRRPARISVRVRPSATRAFEGELVALDVRAEGQGDGHVRWTLHPGAEIDPGDVTAAEGAQARFTFTPDRWGRRPIGSMDVVLRDRWRLAEGHLTVTLPKLDCYPAPADQRTKVDAQTAAEPARRASGPDLGRGHRVLRRTRVRAGRPAAQHQLAGQYQTRAPAGEHLRRRALAGRGAARRRHLGRGRARVVGS